MKRLPFLSALTCLSLCPMTALAQTTWLAADSGDGFATFASRSAEPRRRW
jgi:hypothetical protein